MKVRLSAPVPGLSLVSCVLALSVLPVSAWAQSGSADDDTTDTDVTVRGPDVTVEHDKSTTDQSSTGRSSSDDDKDTTTIKKKKRKSSSSSSSEGTTGSAQSGETTHDDPNTVGQGTAPRNLPPVRSTNEERPPPPAPEAPRVGIVKQAGIGGDVAYARAHVLELGGTAGFTAASDFTQVTIAPSIGWFLIDNLELSAIAQFSHIASGGVDANYVTLLAEPSFHIPIQDYLFGFAGLGAGLTWIEGPGAGFALAPRIGLNIMVGRSGVLTPQLQLQYSTHEAVATTQGSLLAVSVTYGGGIGYTVMW